MYRDYKKSQIKYLEKNLLKSYLKKNVQENQFDLFQSTALNLLIKQTAVKKILEICNPLL